MEKINNDCGPACLKIVAKYFDISITYKELIKEFDIHEFGVTLFDLHLIAKKIGFTSRGVRINFENLVKSENLPAIIHWQKNHFIVLMEKQENNIIIGDPTIGFVIIQKNYFLKNWAEKDETGVALIIKPKNNFR